MAKSKYEYVKLFERDDTLLSNCWIVVRIDGKGFHRFSDTHKFIKPNDENALRLINAAAQAVMEELREVILAFGESDEYSFVLRKDGQLYKRRESKIVTTIVSLFTSNYALQWSNYMKTTKLVYAPSFDGRAVLYPSDLNLRDYLSWRQADTHTNNLYNTVFWNLVLSGGRTEAAAELELRGTRSGDKNEILFSKFNINYSELPEMFRKGTILLWRDLNPEKPPEETTDELSAATEDPSSCSKNSSFVEAIGLSNAKPAAGTFKRRRKAIVQLHEDLIGNEFWEQNRILAI